MNKNNQVREKQVLGQQVLGHQVLGQQVLGQQGFCAQDILWALGIWSVILSLSPVVLFYVLMVN